MSIACPLPGPGPRRRDRLTGFAAPETASPLGFGAYVRRRDLPRLLGLIDLATASDAEIAHALRRALRIERARGRAGHGGYDPRRHAALARALAAETDPEA
jgi:hypothetical protein